jgi:hypothetical protein
MEAFRCFGGQGCTHDTLKKTPVGMWGFAVFTVTVEVVPPLEVLYNSVRLNFCM